MLFSCTDRTEFEPVKHYEIHIMMKNSSCAITLNGVTTFYRTETSSVHIIRTQRFDDLFVQNLSDGELYVVIKDHFTNKESKTGNIGGFLKIK